MAPDGMIRPPFPLPHRGAHCIPQDPAGPARKAGGLGAFPLLTADWGLGPGSPGASVGLGGIEKGGGKTRGGRRGAIRAPYTEEAADRQGQSTILKAATSPLTTGCEKNDPRTAVQEAQGRAVPVPRPVPRPPGCRSPGTPRNPGASTGGLAARSQPTRPLPPRCVSVATAQEGRPQAPGPVLVRLQPGPHSEPSDPQDPEAQAGS